MYTCGRRTTMSTRRPSCGPWSPERVPGWRIAFLASFMTLVAVLVAGCSAGTLSASRSRAPSPAATVAATATTPPITGITPGAEVQRGCASAGGSRLSIAEVQVGTWDSWQQLPSDLPLKPLPTSMAKDVGNLALNAITVELDLATPAGSAPGYVCAITVRMVSYQPLAVPIPNVTRNCSDHAYLDPGGADYAGDCGFVTAPPASAATAFAQSAPGTTITVPIQNSVAPGHPAVFPPAGGGAAKIWLTLKVAASGQYTFVVGLWQDTSGPTLATTVKETFDVDAQHEWTGLSCKDPPWQAQLPPPTNPPTPLLCPGAPPAMA